MHAALPEPTGPLDWSGLQARLPAWAGEAAAADDAHIGWECALPWLHPAVPADAPGLACTGPATR